MAIWAVAVGPADASLVEVVRLDQAGDGIGFVMGDLHTPGLPTADAASSGQVLTGRASAIILLSGRQPYGPIFADVSFLGRTVALPSQPSLGSAGVVTLSDALTASFGSSSSPDPGSAFSTAPTGLLVNGTLDGTVGVTATVVLEGFVPSPTPVPLPAAGGLFAAGLMVLATLRRACARGGQAPCRHM